MTTEKQEAASPKDIMAVRDNKSLGESEHKEKLTDGPFGDHNSLEWRAAERKIVRKLDLTLMPMVWILYMFNYLDRNNIALVY